MRLISYVVGGVYLVLDVQCALIFKETNLPILVAVAESIATSTPGIVAVLGLLVAITSFVISQTVGLLTLSLSVAQYQLGDVK